MWLILAVLWGALMAVGDTSASMILTYVDPRSGRPCKRLTTDGPNDGSGNRHRNYLGDTSGETTKWSSDSAWITYAKEVSTGTGKQEGVYKMNVSTGVETYLAPVTAFVNNTGSCFSPDDSEIFYMRQNGSNVELRAVGVNSPWTNRLVLAVASSGNHEKIGFNADGTLVYFTVVNSSGSWRVVICDLSGNVKSNWQISSGTVMDDSAIWHPTDPLRIITARGGVDACWHVDTLASVTCNPAAHSAVHPLQPWQISIYNSPINNAVNLNTGASVFSNQGMRPYHPHVNPDEGALGFNARVFSEEASSWAEATGPWIYTPTWAQIRDIDFRGGGIQGCHYSTGSGNNFNHVSGKWSPDGRKLLWQSDCEWYTGGPTSPNPTNAALTGPGGSSANRSNDLFMMTFEADPANPTPNTAAHSFTGTAGRMDLGVFPGTP